MAPLRRNLYLVLLPLMLPVLSGAADRRTGGGCAEGAYLATWKAEALGRGAAGLACWIVDEAGALRLEVGLGGTDPLSVRGLFGQRGQGWSLILGDPGQGTFNAWSEPWREVGPGLESWVRNALLCTGAVSGRNASAATPPRPRFAGAGRADSVARWIAPPLTLDRTARNSASAAGFRARMAGRGSGRGDAAETARLEVFRDGGADAGWAAGTRIRLSSSRRPGHVEWTILERTPAFAAPDEVFLPLWTLDRIVEPARVFPGTR